MDSILDALRDVLGEPDFYVRSGTTYTWDYGAMLEYAIAGIILIVVILQIFKLIRSFFDK